MDRNDDLAVASQRARAVPLRTCVGCRRRATKNELLRIVACMSGPSPSVLPDPAGRAPGRGAHLHPTPECLDLALRRRALPRAFRVTDRLDTEDLREHLTQLMRTQQHPLPTEKMEQQLMSLR